MTFKAKSAKSTATPLMTMGCQNVKSVDQYKYLGIVLRGAARIFLRGGLKLWKQKP